ncbi:metallopeptidase family protein [Hyphomicrobium sp. LHD-15]|uniref:metallopeptidase family protein n=1 Tax=Hyphomicrobium sp. LHD-15 TaxID=3072142 RepID=UPI00280E6935|nr:metallopeptidase family protein [Hyphomicrobium sp. LHD-15]MDQ8698955.1 metallopeptidase family protein [Hyphomicrobium sp. LHD-15]
MTGRIDWKGATAPTLADFEIIAASAWERIQPEFREVCGDLVIRIEDFALDEVLDELDIDSPFDLMGLYQGLSLDQKSVLDVPREPDMVFLYRRAILDYWTENGDETLDDIITHVLIHEIGHHFGFSDDDMEEIETQATH